MIPTGRPVLIFRFVLCRVGQHELFVPAGQCVWRQFVEFLPSAHEYPFVVAQLADRVKPRAVDERRYSKGAVAAGRGPPGPAAS